MSSSGDCSGVPDKVAELAGTGTVELVWRNELGGTTFRLTDECRMRYIKWQPDIGLDPAFTIHDREDSADLTNLVRHDLGFSKTENRFPAKGTCLSIYLHTVNAEVPLDEVLRTNYPWCAVWEKELRELFAGYVEAKQIPECARLRRSAALLGADHG